MKKGKLVRERTALARLEASRAKFAEANEDRKAYTSTRTNSRGLIRVINHPARTYAAELKRFDAEIEHLKEVIKNNSR